MYVTAHHLVSYFNIRSELLLFLQNKSLSTASACTLFHISSFSFTFKINPGIGQKKKRRKKERFHPVPLKNYA
jgi:hypothetical protein